MRVWRLARRSYSALDGQGANRAGGRWNSPGLPAVYTASRLSLAALELLVHVDPDTVPADMTAFEIDIPDILEIESLSSDALPANWRTQPNHPACRAAGDRWLRSLKAPILAVPSAIIPAEVNYLINPRHPDARSIHIVDFGPFSFDPRLKKRRKNPHKS